MNKIAPRQLYFFLACIAPVGKLLVMPVKLSSVAANDLWIPVLAQYLLQAGAVFCVLLLAKRNESLYGILEGALGKIAATSVILLFALFLLFAGLLPVLEQKLFVQGVFYDTLPSLVAFAPFFLFSAYVCSKPFASLGRMFDILAPLSVVGLCGVYLLSVTSADYGAVLPVGASGAKGIFGGFASSAAWFYDSAFLLLLLGKFEYTEGMAWKGTAFYLLGGGVVLLFLMTFYGIFEGTSAGHLFAFTKTSRYFSAVTVLGRVDYLFIFALSLVMAFYTVMPLQAAVDCCLEAFGRKKALPTLLSVGINLLFLLLVYLLDFRFGDVQEALKRLFWIFSAFTLLFPALCLLLRRRRVSS